MKKIVFFLCPGLKKEFDLLRTQNQRLITRNEALAKLNEDITKKSKAAMEDAMELLNLSLKVK